MTSFASSRRVLVMAGCVLAAAVVGAQSPEEFARRRLESGRSFLNARSYSEALKDFEAVLQSYPTSASADDALLEIATYHFQIARNLELAESRVRELMKVYPNSDSAAMGLVLEGRIALARGYSKEAVATAIASFERVARLFPGSEAVPTAMYYAGEASRLGGDQKEAIRRFSQVSTQFPNSPWAAKAMLGLSFSLTRTGQTSRAMEQLQRVRTGFPGSPEAAVALDWNSVLYRLYVRGVSQTPFVFSGRSVPSAPAKLKDVIDIALDRDDNVLVVTPAGITVYDAKASTKTLAVQAVESVAFDRLGALITVHETGLRVEGKTAVPLVMPIVNGKAREFKAADAVMNSSGEYLVADQEQKTILRFLADGKASADFAQRVETRRLAISDLDEVIALDRNRKSVSLFGRDGGLIRQIAERGTNYQLRNPTDIAFDRLGHIYVLDRTSVLVFSSDAAKLIATFTTKEKTPGALGTGENLALDAAGRLYVFDGRTDSVKVYR